MPLSTRRVYRLSFTMAISLAVAYGLQFPLPFLAPLFALILGAKPGPPPGLKGLIGLILMVLLTLGTGLLLTPMLIHYALPTILVIALCVYLSTYISIGKGKILVGLLLTVGVTLITAAGIVEYSLAVMVIQSLALCIALAVLSQWVVYPWFPENGGVQAPEDVPLPSQAQSFWIASRATLIIMPAYLLTLTNPAMYLPVIMKTVNLAQQSSVLNARNAGKELLGSTLLAGVLAIMFWCALDLVTNLWMFSLWMLLFGVFIASKLYQVFPSRYSPEYWQNVGVTMLILLGPAVEDSANGDDVYAAFVIRMTLFVGVSIYAWLAILALERLRIHRLTRLDLSIGRH